MLYNERIVQLRERNNISQITIANKLEITNSHYAHCEKEDELFPIKHLNSVCNYFNVSLDYIFSFSEVKQYNNSTKEIDKEKASKRLVEFRKENKITQAKLAKTLNTVQQAISKYEKGMNIIATPFLYTICKKYHISADYLLGKVDNPKYLK